MSASPSSPALPSVEDAVALGLTRDEYAGVCRQLGRAPNQVELAMFSLMWSEHCAYKHSRKLLRTLPTEGPRVVMGPGENAGAVDVGDGLVCAFKVESHNHPSAVEPFQGAATGVGGILRDIFALGARPVAAPWKGSTAEGWLCDSTLNAQTRSPLTRTAPAFSPGPMKTAAPSVGSVRSSAFECL